MLNFKSPVQSFSLSANSILESETNDPGNGFSFCLICDMIWGIWELHNGACLYVLQPGSELSSKLRWSILQMTDWWQDLYKTSPILEPSKPSRTRRHNNTCQGATQGSTGCWLSQQLRNCLNATFCGPLPAWKPQFTVHICRVILSRNCEHHAHVYSNSMNKGPYDGANS